MTGGAEWARWGPEVALALACLGGAWSVAGRAAGVIRILVAGALLLLACDAALGAAEYAGLGGGAAAAAHAALTTAFKTAGFTAVLAAQIALLAPGGRSRVAAVAGLALAGFAASFWLPLPPVLVLAHVAMAAAQRRAGALAAGAALLGVTLSQVLMPEGVGRLAVLHLGLAAWALALPGAIGDAFARATPAGVRFGSVDAPA